ncbi:MAG: hypothetical protein N2203_07305, partial [Bacteroidia bacterium]|nr:hypothetical protein [Bacteroidia bacterium]
MQINVEKIKSINNLSVIRSVSMVVATITMLVFYFDPVDFASNAYIMLLLWSIYWLFSGIYFYEQINLWKNVQRFRFLSWYYISFSIVGII